MVWCGVVCVHVCVAGIHYCMVCTGLWKCSVDDFKVKGNQKWVWLRYMCFPLTHSAGEAY